MMVTPTALLLLSTLPKRQPDSCVWLRNGAIHYRCVAMVTNGGLTTTAGGEKKKCILR